MRACVSCQSKDSTMCHPHLSLVSSLQWPSQFTRRWILHQMLTCRQGLCIISQCSEAITSCPASCKVHTICDMQEAAAPTFATTKHRGCIQKSVAAILETHVGRQHLKRCPQCTQISASWIACPGTESGPHPSMPPAGSALCMHCRSTCIQHET